MVTMKNTSAGFETMALAEITAYPFGFILYFDPSETWDYHGTDITACVDCKYDEKCDVSMPWKIEEMNDVLPESYRSRDQIMRCFENNKERCKDDE